MKKTHGTPRQDPPRPAERKERLKAALQANIAKRKAQAKARSGEGGVQTDRSAEE